MTIMIIAMLAIIVACALCFRPFQHLPYPYTADAETMARCAAFDAWDDARRSQNVFAGLHFFSRTSCRRTFDIACRHWPHLLCWQWILSVDFRPHTPALFAFHRSGPGLVGGEAWHLRLFWCCCISYKRQASDRIATSGPMQQEAPAVYPREPHLRLVA